MARDFIAINTTAPAAIGAGPLKTYVRQMRDAYQSGQWIKAVMVHNNDGTNFTDIETLFGLPAGSGQVVFDLVNGSVGAMEGTFQVADCVVLTEKVG